MVIQNHLSVRSRFSLYSLYYTIGVTSSSNPVGADPVHDHSSTVHGMSVNGSVCDDFWTFVYDFSLIFKWIFQKEVLFGTGFIIKLVPICYSI